MATYKQECIHCHNMIDRDAHLCPKCGSRSPFGYGCPSCLKPVEPGDAVCSACGRALATCCPYCTQVTFAGTDICGWCGRSLLIRCQNKRCNELQFFENTKCLVCGKAIKNAAQQIDEIKKGQR